jgi:hypothetical protein
METQKQTDLLRLLDKMTDLVAAEDWPKLAVAARRFAAKTRLKKGRKKSRLHELRAVILRAQAKAKASGRRLTITKIAKLAAVSRQTVYAVLKDQDGPR